MASTIIYHSNNLGLGMKRAQEKPKTAHLFMLLVLFCACVEGNEAIAHAITAKEPTIPVTAAKVSKTTSKITLELFNAISQLFIFKGIHAQHGKPFMQAFKVKYIV